MTTLHTGVRARPTDHASAAMTTLVGTELLKLRTVRAPMALIATGVAVTVFLAVQSVAGSGADGAPSIGTAAARLAVLSAAAHAQLVALVVGILTVTAERRHGTLTATLLQTPRRVRLMAAKGIAAGLVGLAMGLLSLVCVVLVGLGSGALQAPLINVDVVLVAVGQLVGCSLYGLLGVGIGALLWRSPPVAVLLPVAWLLLLESYLGAFAPVIGRWLPGQLTSALANSGELPGLVGVWAGGVGLLGYGLVLLAAGTRWLVRSDVA
jgi:ABC-2 type transport system permease protein